MRILNICVFASTSDNRALILYFQKKNLKIKKKTCQSKESPFSPTPPFQEKNNSSHPSCQIWGEV